MTTDDESGILAGNVFVSMCEAEWAPVKVLVEYDDPGLIVPMILNDIVVSLYQQQLRTGNIPAPTQKKIRFAIEGAMKEVAHDQNPGGLKILYLRDEPLHITGVGCGWYRNTAFTKMS